MHSAVRPARPDDVGEILALIRELAAYERAADEVRATEGGLRAALFGDEPAVHAHVAELGGAVDGLALWFRSFSTWTGAHGVYLEDLFVRPEARGHGLGRGLLATLAERCVSNGWQRLEWTVLDWNEPALEFYRSLGAVGMAEWTVHRLTGEPLAALAARSS